LSGEGGSDTYQRKTVGAGARELFYHRAFGSSQLEDSICLIQASGGTEITVQHMLFTQDILAMASSKLSR
jgi:hypothetical protein